MVRWLCILCFLVALWPGLALAQSADLMEAFNQYQVLNEQGRYAEAELFARKALELSEKEFGPDHPHTGSFLNNLAELYRAQGRYAEAEPPFRRSLAIREKALGADHPDVGQSLNNLALLYYNQGGYAEAEPLYKRALAIWEKAFGKGHPLVAQSLANYAALLRETGRSAEAVDWSTAESVTVKLSEFAFSPATLTFRAGAPYRLILENAGGVTHFFVSQAFFKSIAARELRSGGEATAAPRLEKIALEPGATKELWFVATETGTFDLVCTAFLHELFGMTGSIQVL